MIERQRLDQLSAAIERERAAQNEREIALVREKAALRRGQRALAGAGALFACMIVGVIGWYKQHYLREQYHWQMAMKPRVLTLDEEQRKAASPEADFKECENGCPTMIVVPAGKFTMGSPASEAGHMPREAPQREVAIARPFAVGKTEVTFAQWEHCAAVEVCPNLRDEGWGRGERPVIYVTWDDAKSYVRWLSRMTGKDYRLLTEAEWEYAARAGKNTRYSFGDDVAMLGDFAWYSGNWNSSDGATQPVGQKKPNAFGLHDMHGNVWEWVEDHWHPDHAGAAADGSARQAGQDPLSRTVRGGSWHDDHATVRSASRDDYTMAYQVNIVGFRVARTLGGSMR